MDTDQEEREQSVLRAGLTAKACVDGRDCIVAGYIRKCKIRGISLFLPKGKTCFLGSRARNWTSIYLSISHELNDATRIYT